VSRLRPGVAVARARAEMATIAGRLASQYPESNTGFGATVLPWREQLAGKSRLALLVLLGGVGFLLLIACANLANLFLTRSAARSRELAIRATLGAGRLRLVRQLLVETLLVALAGGAAGVLLAAAGVRLAAGWLPADIPRLGESRVDLGVLLFAAALSLATGLLFGLQPAVRAARPVLADTLHDAARCRPRRSPPPSPARYGPSIPTRRSARSRPSTGCWRARWRRAASSRCCWAPSPCSPWR
jgi:putative ABC transport system permease protein